MNAHVAIQVDNNGTWRTVTTLPNGETQKLMMELQSQKRIHPTKRVRAIDAEGRLIDLLP